ncbi:MAG: ABC transporter permease, partial [Zetaproteobacteria bacterium]
MSALRKVLRTRTNIVVGGVIVGLMTLTAVFAPLLAPYHPTDDANLMFAQESPSRQFLFGTDSQGRDILSRVIFGARISLSVGLISQGLNSLIGIVLGLTAGFFGRWWD